MEPAAVGSIVLWGGLASLGAGLATGLGALPVLVVRRIPRRVEDAMLGFAAGVMLAASFFSLILPGIAAAEQQGASRSGAAAIVALGILVGAFTLWLIHQRVPHEHFLSGPEGPPSEKVVRIWLFIFAITLHNLPEGLAVGVGFGGGDIGNGIAIALGIGVQNMPEGLAVALALASLGYRRGTALLVAALTGLVEPLGGLVGVTVVSLAAGLLPWGLAFAAGAMLFVISDEIIPETHGHGMENQGTLGLMIGLVVMLFLDVALG